MKNEKALLLEAPEIGLILSALQYLKDNLATKGTETYLKELSQQIKKIERKMLS